MIILSFVKKIRNFMERLRDDNVAAFSAQAAFFIILSSFPFLMFLLTLIQYLPIRESELMSVAVSVIPPAFNSYMLSIINEIYQKASGTIISITVITALWSASRGFLAIIRGLNSVYQIDETRNYIKLRITSTFYTLMFAIILIISLGFLVFGNSLYIWIQRKFPLLRDLALILISIRTTVSLCILVLFFILLYIFVPDRKSKLLDELPGAVLTSVGWMVFSYLYSYYIEHMGSYSYMYGSLTAIVLLMLWLYACMYMMFLGAEINVYLQSRRTARK